MWGWQKVRAEREREMIKHITKRLVSFCLSLSVSILVIDEKTERERKGKGRVFFLPLRSCPLVWYKGKILVLSLNSVWWNETRIGSIERIWRRFVGLHHKHYQDLVAIKRTLMIWSLFSTYVRQLPGVLSVRPPISAAKHAHISDNLAVLFVYTITEHTHTLISCNSGHLSTVLTSFVLRNT